MSETTPQESPDFLAAPKKGEGVRRLNRVPLMVVGGIGALVILGIVYTFHERSNVGGRGAVGPQPPVAATNIPPVTPRDYVAMEPEYDPVETPKEETGATAEVVTSMPTESAAYYPTQTPQSVSEAMQNRLRIIQRIEERRLSQFEAALSAETGAEGLDQGQQQNARGGTGANDPAAYRQQMLQGILTGLSGQSGGQSPMGGPMGGMGGMGGGMAAENRQLEKAAFLAGSPEAEIYLNQQRQAAIAPSQEVKAGTVIPGVMISGLNSDLPGQIVAQVRENVYDSFSGQSLLIPAGSRLIGRYDSSITLGQSRALVGWERIIYPDGSSISLDRMPGADVGGYAGFKDKVNNHYVRIFGHGILLSVFSAGIQLSQPQASNGENYNNSQVISGALGQQMGQLGMQMAQRNMNIQPTIEIRPGYQFNVMVTKDIILPTWTGHPLAQN